MTMREFGDMDVLVNFGLVVLAFSMMFAGIIIDATVLLIGGLVGIPFSGLLSPVIVLIYDLWLTKEEKA